MAKVFHLGIFFPMWENFFILNSSNRTSFVFGSEYAVVLRSKYVFRYKYVFKSKYVFRCTYYGYSKVDTYLDSNTYLKRAIFLDLVIENYLLYNLIPTSSLYSK